MELDRYCPSPDWFQHPISHSIHGLTHVGRVLVWANRLASEAIAAGEEVDLEVVRWAAALHDVGRHGDGWDPQHGERSALWIKANPTIAVPDLTPSQREILAYCCRWHVPKDTAVPGFIPELRILKDADGLDRVRIYDLNPAMLRSDAARALESAAWSLFHATSPLNGQDQWQRVRLAALDLGFWH